MSLWFRSLLSKKHYICLRKKLKIQYSFWSSAKNAISYPYQVSECMAALQALHIRVVINGEKALANVLSVPLCIMPSSWKSVGRGNGSGKMVSIVLHTYFLWSIALIGFQYIQIVLLAIRGLWKEAVCTWTETATAAAGCLSSMLEMSPVF